MLSIQGAIQILPQSASAESATISLTGPDGEKQNAVVITFISENGPIQVILPSDAVDGVVAGIIEAKQRGEVSDDLYIPKGGMAEAQAIAKKKEEIEKGNNNG